MDVWGEILDKIGRYYKNIFTEEDGLEPNPFVLVDDFHELADGFRKAANIVVDTIVKNHNLNTAQMIPAALALYRHAVELNLKSIRSQLVEKVSSDYAFDRRHDLMELWLPIESYLLSHGFVFEEGALHYRVGELVKELSKVDGFGDRFRYPDSRHPNARLGMWTNLEALKLSVGELSLLNYGFLEIISILKNKDG